MTSPITHMNALPVLAAFCLLFGQLATGADAAHPIDKLNKLLDRFKNNPSGKVPPPISAQSTQTSVPAITRYVTPKVHTLNEDESQAFIGQLCGQGAGKSVNVTMVLNNNPGWDSVKGVVEFYVMDSQIEENSTVLCTNVDANGAATSSCLVESWPSSNDIIIVATAGPVCAISFTLDVQFHDPDSHLGDIIRSHQLKAPTRRKPDGELFAATKTLGLPVFLTQTVSVFPEVRLSYMQEALISFAWCTNDCVPRAFSVESTITSADGESSYTQYICDELPCDVGINNIAHNGNQLPSNTIVTKPMVYGEIYVVIVNWGGAYYAPEDSYAGHFLYNAVQIRYD